MTPILVNLMVKKIVSYFIFFCLKGISVLPLSILYSFGTILYFIIFHIVGYRRNVVHANLNLCFPDKSSAELDYIEKNFYKHLVQVMVESIKSFSISKPEIDKRVMVDPLMIEKADTYFRKGQSILIVMGHYGNWEWVPLRLGGSTKFDSFAVYTPLKNKIFDGLVKQNRDRFGTTMLSSNELKRMELSPNSAPSIIGFVGDQCPVYVENSFWTTFLGRETPVFRGFEKYAKILNASVWYCEMEKLKKGYYRLNFTHLTDSPNELKDDEITQIHTTLLEQSIKRRPEYWLWTHRRWKRSHLKPADLK